MHYDLGYFDLERITCNASATRSARGCHPCLRYSLLLLPMCQGRSFGPVAEREGFEPPIGLHLCRISSAVHSTTLPPLLKAPSQGAGPLWLGALIGEDGGPDKACERENPLPVSTRPPLPGTNARERRPHCRFDAYLSGARWSPIRDPNAETPSPPALPRTRGRERTIGWGRH